VIFESSILFERGWDSKFDKVISVFAPKEERVYRCKMDTDRRVDEIWTLFDKEMSELSKNNKSDYVIHNYDTGPDLLTQVNNIDLEITNYSFEKVS
jgi:dephospho-CoA kinase